MKKYNYNEMVQEIGHAARQHPDIESFYTDRYTINDGDVCYPALVLTTNSVSVGEQVSNYSFNLLYADRLTEDRSNRTQIQSRGIDAITEVVNVLRTKLDMDVDAAFTVTPFTGQFADNVAGVVANGLDITTASNIGACTWFKFDPRC